MAELSLQSRISDSEGLIAVLMLSLGGAFQYLANLNMAFDGLLGCERVTKVWRMVTIPIFAGDDGLMGFSVGMNFSVEKTTLFQPRRCRDCH